MKKNVNGSSGTTSTSTTTLQLPKQTRHIVTWSQEEDDILRDQIRDHGTDNWAIIASKFKDKTTRQCRRRWYIYLNSDFKKGGWSPEEDMLLCEAQKIFGNRWTEIAKVVSGRTDNAVKNRFNTLCKKRAKAEALAKENSTSFINLNNKRILFQTLSSADGLSETGTPFKKIRRNHITGITENCVRGEKMEGECEKTNPQLRSPFAVIVQNFDILRDLPTECYDNTITLAKDEGVSEDMTEGMYLKKDDPKIIALMQQAQLLSSLAHKVNTENTYQSFENAWKTLQDFLNQSKEDDVIRFRASDMDHQLEDSTRLAEDLNSSKEGSRGSWRQSDIYAESTDSSEYSTRSTIINHLSSCDKTTCSEGDVGATQQQHDTEAELHLIHTGNSNGHGDVDQEIFSNAITNQSREILNADVLPCNDLKADDGTGCTLSNIHFGSPSQLTPLFRTFASGIPTPQFSESEKHFLLKTLGVDSASPSPSTKTLQSPPCKRALLQSL